MITAKELILSVIVVSSLYGAADEHYLISAVRITHNNKADKFALTVRQKARLLEYAEFNPLDQEKYDALLKDLQQNNFSAMFAQRRTFTGDFALAAHQLRTARIAEKLRCYSADDREGLAKAWYVALSTEDALQKEIVRLTQEKYNTLLMLEASRLARYTLRYVYDDFSLEEYKKIAASLQSF